MSMNFPTSPQVITEPIVLQAEDRINAQTSTVDDVDIVISYMEIT